MKNAISICILIFLSFVSSCSARKEVGASVGRCDGFTRFYDGLWEFENSASDSDIAGARVKLLSVLSSKPTLWEEYALLKRELGEERAFACLASAVRNYGVVTPLLAIRAQKEIDRNDYQLIVDYRWRRSTLAKLVEKKLFVVEMRSDDSEN